MHILMIESEIFYVIIGLFIGFMIVYVTKPKPKLMVKNPTINNIDKTIYIDENGVKYKYIAREISCQVT